MTADKPTQDSRIQPADPQARSRAMRIAAIGLVLAALLAGLLTAYEQEISAWLDRHAMELIERPGIITLLLFIVMLPMIILSGWVFREGSRIVRAQRFPLPGQQVIRDTPIIEGGQAVRRGRAIQVIALLMAVVSVAMPLLPQWFLTQINQ